MRREPIVVERVLGADPATVFAAWGDAESLRTWMRPASDIRDCEVEMDFRVGGRFRIRMGGAERSYVQHGTFLEIEPPQRIVMTWISEWMPAGEEHTLVRVELEPLGRHHTRLVLTHGELPDSGSYDGHAQGWAVILGRLDTHLAERSAAPTDPRPGTAARSG